MKKLIWLLAILLIIISFVSVAYIYIWPKVFGLKAGTNRPLTVSISNISADQAINLPFFLRGQTGWSSFEGQSGIVRVLNANKKAITNWVPMRTVAGSDNFIAELPRGDRDFYTASGWLEFQKDNPSGILNNEESMLWPIKLVARP